MLEAFGIDFHRRKPDRLRTIIRFESQNDSSAQSSPYSARMPLQSRRMEAMKSSTLSLL